MKKFSSLQGAKAMSKKSLTEVNGGRSLCLNEFGFCPEGTVFIPSTCRCIVENEYDC